MGRLTGSVVWGRSGGYGGGAGNRDRTRASCTRAFYTSAIGYIRGLLEEVDNKVLRTSTALGVPTGDVPALTVWGSITEVCKDLIKQGAKLTQYTSGNQLILNNQKELLEKHNLVSSKANLTDTMLNSQVLSLITGLVDKMSIRGAGNQGTVDRDYERMALRVNECEREIFSLKNGAQGVIQGPETGGTPQEELVHLRIMIGELTDAVAFLKLDNIALRAELNTETVVFGGCHFQSATSYVKFVQEHVPSNNWMYCYDFISIFELYTAESGNTTDDNLKISVLAGKVGYKDVPSAKIDNSFRTMIPQIFGTAQDKADASKKMAKLTTMEVWDHPSSQSGLKEDISQFFDTNIESLLMQVEGLHGANQKASQVFAAMINGVSNFWHALETWIGRFEKDLTSQMGGDDPAVHKPAVWKLICWMLHAMFNEFLKRRRPGTMHAVFSSNEERTVEEMRNKCASIVHGTIMAHRFMKELISDNFIRHSIFNATLLEFLLKNKASHAQIKAGLVKMGVLESQVKSIQAQLDRELGKKQNAALKQEKKKGKE